MKKCRNCVQVKYPGTRIACVLNLPLTWKGSFYERARSVPGNWSADRWKNEAIYQKNRLDQEVAVHTPRGRFELPRREAPVAFEATAFPG